MGCKKNGEKVYKVFYNDADVTRKLELMTFEDCLFGVLRGTTTVYTCKRNAHGVKDAHIDFKEKKNCFTF